MGVGSVCSDSGDPSPLFTLPSPVATAAEGEGLEEKVVRTQLDQLHTEELESFWEELKREYGRFFPRRSAPETSLIWQALPERGPQIGNLILVAFGRYLFHEVLYNGKLLGTIIVLTVFSMILRTLQTAFERNQVSEIAYAIAFMVIIILRWIASLWRLIPPGPRFLA